MKKILIVNNKEISFLGDIKGQIECFLRDFVECYELGIDEFDKIEDVDLYLVFTLDDYIRLSQLVDDNDKIHITKLTMVKDDLLKLNKFRDNEVVYLLEESREMAREYMRHIVAYNFGFNLLPSSVDEFKMDSESKCLLPENLSLDFEFSPENCFRIKGLLIELGSMVDMGMKLNLDGVLRDREIELEFMETETHDKVVNRFINLFLMYEKELRVLIKMFDFAIISVDSKGIVHIYNEKARKIFNIDRQAAMGNDASKVFEELGFDKVLNDYEVINDEVINIDGKDIIYSIEPLDKLDTRHGAVAIARMFEDEEIKQHRIREKIAGKGHQAKYNIMDIVGESQAIVKVKNDAYRMSQSDSSVLITGESGTGKELVAQSIHQLSARKEKPFVAVNCGALPESILESELFGYEEGAFSGARKGGKPGLFEMAHRGTLFLDEIGEMPARLQLRFLRVIQEREVMRLGSDSVINIDIRIIAATNKDLFKEVKDGRFRSDLYYRLNILPLISPSLRSRREDIPILIRHFMKKFDCSLSFSDEAKRRLMNYDWPGNIRELGNMVEYLKNMGLKHVEVDDLPFRELDIESTEAMEEIKYDDDIISFLKNDRDDIVKTGYILKLLLEAKGRGERIGRRSILTMSLEDGIHLSERDVRRILLLLEVHGAVVIGKGRAGTVVKEYGEKIYKLISNKTW